MIKKKTGNVYIQKQVSTPEWRFVDVNMVVLNRRCLLVKLLYINTLMYTFTCSFASKIPEKDTRNEGTRMLGCMYIVPPLRSKSEPSHLILTWISPSG